MLKNTKVVGVAAAIALLTGVAFAPSATAVNGDVPTMTDPTVNDNFDSGARVDYFVDNVRTGCEVTTTLGSRSKTATARFDSGARSNGKVSNFITAPTYAGEYTIKSMVSTDCKSDAGYKRAQDMAVDITVGDEVDFNAVWDDVGNSVEIAGTVDEDGVDLYLGTVKILFLVKGKVVAQAYTDEDNDGDYTATIAGRNLNSRGFTRVTMKLSSNKDYYGSDTFQVNQN